VGPTGVTKFDRSEMSTFFRKLALFCAGTSFGAAGSFYICVDFHEWKATQKDTLHTELTFRPLTTHAEATQATREMLKLASSHGFYLEDYAPTLDSFEPRENDYLKVQLQLKRPSHAESIASLKRMCHRQPQCMKEGIYTSIW
jgi:hypothetical protein